MSPSSFMLPYIYPKKHPGTGILTCFPFDKGLTIEVINHFNTEFPYLLGSTNPYPNTVHTEPFSTSVFKDLT